MRRASSDSLARSCPPAKRPKLASSDKTTVNASEDSTGQEVNIPRSYQTELVEQAKNENLVVCLPTGSGKTYIAVMLIKEMSHEIRKNIDDGGKRTVFLVKTRALVHQQSDYIRIHTDLTVGKYYGELGVDQWEKERWIIEFEQHQVLIFTAQVFLNLVDHNFFPLHKVNLLIFDECQHSSGENCYAALMKRHYDNCQCPPRILGLTASISAKKIKPAQLSKAAEDIEKIYRARIASGSNREESNQYGTSVNIEPIRCSSYKDDICNVNESIKIAFDTIESISSNLQPYLEETKIERMEIEQKLSETMLTTDYLGDNIVNYNTQSIDYTIFLQSENMSISRLKRYLADLKHIGYEVGLYGLLLASKALEKVLKRCQMSNVISDPKGKELFDESVERIDRLINEILNNLVEINQNNNNVLFSCKVLRLFERIKKAIDNNNLGRCIIFVERIYAASVLSAVLIFLFEKLLPNDKDRPKIKYLTGTRATPGEATMTAKYLSQVIKEFRTGEITILVATAIVEEGIDIPKCNIVFRFNKPANFSSYMQSKGRARDRQNASYVLLVDASDEKTFLKDSEDYENYDEIEEMLQKDFSIDDNDAGTDELNQIEPYRIENGVVISAIRAAQILYEYCAVLGSGRICPPRILFYKTNDATFKSILSMPASCPIRDDIICENRKKKLAKFQCCLKMIELLHQRGELNEYCLPHRRLSSITNDIDNEDWDESSKGNSNTNIETFPNQICTFPSVDIVSSNIWYLYRINIESEQEKLGFVVPSKLVDLPKFNLYGVSNEILTVDLIYVKKIDYKNYENVLEQFCCYLFENVFDGILNKTGTILQFDPQQSLFKLLPCLLTNFDDIDSQTMISICNRLNKPVESPSHLSDNELYVAWHLPNKPLYTIMSDNFTLKPISDPWDHQTKLETIKTYADYFRNKEPNCSISQDSLMAKMQSVHNPRINYLYPSLQTNTDQSSTVSPSDRSIYYPIEFLHYAPVNRIHLQLFYKLPSILLRISQLYYTEQLRILFASVIDTYTLRDVKQMPQVVSFTDCLKTIDLSSNAPSLLSPRTILPLTQLTTSNSLIVINQSNDEQPLTDILLQSLIHRSTGERMNYENLEILGDCFLKLAVSMSLYIRYPMAGAGQLTFEKKKQISNKNFYRLAVKNDLKKYLYVNKIDFRGKNANWIPPGYKIDEAKITNSQRYTHQTVKKKAFSDMIEAFIGAFLISSNYLTTIKFMHKLGLDVIPLDDLGNPMEVPSILRGNIDTNSNEQIIDKFFLDEKFDKIETKIKYSFENKAYLIAAFTHPSSFSNRITDCYERLEFLGDALLDFLITRYIFINYKDKLTPGQVTDIRQDLGNNSRLAYISTACAFQKKILHSAPDLLGQISSYAGDEDLFPKDQTTDQYLSKNLDEWADTTAPKALADVFEALVGAIFLDSGNSLEIVWRVIEPFFHKYIEQAIVHANLNPIRWFTEQQGKVFQEYVDQSDDKSVSVCIVETRNGDRFEGRGPNKKRAKLDACRKAKKEEQTREDFTK